MLRELRLFPTNSQKIGAIVNAVSRLRLAGRFMSAREMAVTATVVVLLQLLGPALARRSLILILAAGWAQIAVVLFMIALPALRDMPRSVRRQLIESGIRVCWRCGYDLRGTPVEAPCPECGADCTDLASRLQHPLPEAATFPELREFRSEEEARRALEDVRKRLGRLYSCRLLLAFAAAILMAVLVIVAWDFIDPVGQLEDSSPWVFRTRFGVELLLTLFALVGWYSWVAHLTRKKLRQMLPPSSGR